MFVDFRHKLVFCHIPKTGGTSITKLMQHVSGDGVYANGAVDKHISIREIIRIYMSGINVSEYIPFACVRNPWDLIHSDYHFCLRAARSVASIKEGLKRETGKAESGWTKKLDRVSRLSFDEFVRSEYLANENGSNFWRAYCQDRDGNDLVKSILRFESMQSDWARFCRGVGMPITVIPLTNATQVKPDYRSEYTPYTRCAVGRINALLIERTGYEFI